MSRHDSDVTQASISLWQSAGSVWRLFPRALRWWVIVLVILAVVWLIATVITQRAIDTELAAIEARGEPLTLAELAPRIAPGVLNAAAIYEAAFSSMPDPNNQKYDHALADPTFARSYLGAREAALSQIRQAANVRDCAFPVDWRQPVYELNFPHYARLREAARLLVLNSSLLAASGKADLALGEINAAYNISPHTMSDPVLIGALVGYAIIGIAHSGLEESLSLSAPSPGACRPAYDKIALIDVETPFHRALQGERAGAIAAFEDIRARRVSLRELIGGPDRFGVLRLVAAVYPTLGRPLFNVDEASALRLYRRMLEAHELPHPQSGQALSAVAADVDSLPAYTSLLTKMGFPVFGRADWSMRKAAATLAVDRAALAVAAFKAQTGSYPDALDEVQALGWDLPTDPLTGDPLLYRCTPRGFTVWSIGPNMEDDGGVAYDSKTMDYSSGPYDITFICDPERITDERAARKAAWDQSQVEKAEAENAKAENASSRPRRRHGWGRLPPRFGGAQ